jgi:hypothetical protein
MIFVRRILHFRGEMGVSLKTRASWMMVDLSWKKTPVGRAMDVSHYFVRCDAMQASAMGIAGASGICCCVV